MHGEKTLTHVELSEARDMQGVTRYFTVLLRIELFRGYVEEGWTVVGTRSPPNGLIWACSVVNILLN